MEGGRGGREREREREDAVDNQVKKGLFTCKYEHIRYGSQKSTRFL